MIFENFPETETIADIETWYRKKYSVPKDSTATFITAGTELSSATVLNESALLERVQNRIEVIVAKPKAWYKRGTKRPKETLPG